MSPFWPGGTQYGHPSDLVTPSMVTLRYLGGLPWPGFGGLPWPPCFGGLPWLAAVLCCDCSAALCFNIALGGWLQLCTRAAMLHWGWLRRCAGGSAPSLALRTWLERFITGWLPILCIVLFSCYLFRAVHLHILYILFYTSSCFIHLLILYIFLFYTSSYSIHLLILYIFLYFLFLIFSS